MTDLTKGQLDELERRAQVCNCKYCQELELPLIAMAKRAEAAERERDALRRSLEYIVCDWDDCACDGDYEQLGRDVGEDARRALAALAQSTTDAGGAE